GDRAPCGEGGDVPDGAGAVAGRGPRNRPRAGAPTRSERSVGFHHFGPPRSPGRPACCAYRRWHRNGRRTACRATTTSTPHAAGAAIAGAGAPHVVLGAGAGRDGGGGWRARPDPPTAKST